MSKSIAQDRARIAAQHAAMVKANRLSMLRAMLREAQEADTDEYLYDLPALIHAVETGKFANKGEPNALGASARVGAGFTA